MCEKNRKERRKIIVIIQKYTLSFGHGIVALGFIQISVQAKIGAVVSFSFNVSIAFCCSPHFQRSLVSIHVMVRIFSRNYSRVQCPKPWQLKHLISAFDLPSQGFHLSPVSPPSDLLSGPIGVLLVLPPSCCFRAFHLRFLP